MHKININIIGSNYFLDLLEELDLGYNISSETQIRSNYIHNSLRIVIAEKLHLTELRKLITENVPTVFLLNKKDFLFNNKFNLLPFHTILILPVEILTLKEILKILITKHNFFSKSKIDGNQISFFHTRIYVKVGQLSLNPDKVPALQQVQDIQV